MSFFYDKLRQKIENCAEKLTLNAKYDSYLLLFDRVNKSKIELSVGPKILKNDESCYWFFSKEKSWTNWDNGFAFGHYLTANIYMNNGDNLEVVFSKEIPIKQQKVVKEDGKILKEVCPPASIIFTPSVAGMLCAYYVCKNI